MLFSVCFTEKDACRCRKRTGLQTGKRRTEKGQREKIKRGQLRNTDGRLTERRGKSNRQRETEWVILKHGFPLAIASWLVYVWRREGWTYGVLKRGLVFPTPTGGLSHCITHAWADRTVRCFLRLCALIISAAYCILLDSYTFSY